MITARPDWADGLSASYKDIVESWGYEVLAFETFGSYQGDHLALLRRPDGVGLIVFGYGSCSGCDHLQAITPWGDDEDDDWQPVIDYAEELRTGVHWESNNDGLAAWVDAHPENHWWSYEDEIARWLNANLGTSLKAGEDW